MKLAVSLPDDLRAFADARAASEGFASVNDYLRDLVIRDLAGHESSVRELRSAWAEGARSAILDDEPEDILDQIIAEHPAQDAAA